MPPGSTNLDAIAAELGDLPLALHLAGNYLTRYRHAITPAAYLAHLHGLGQQYRSGALQHPSLHNSGPSPTGHVQHVARTFALSYDKLDSSDPIDDLALALLARAAYFAPGEPIPRELLLATLGRSGGRMDVDLQAEDALARLVTLGLVESGVDGALRLHRLVAAFVQERVDDPGAQAAVEQTLLETAQRLNEPVNPAGLLALQRHLRFVTEAALPRDDEQAAALCSALSYHLWLLADYAGAEVFLGRGLAIHEQMAHPDLLQIAGNLNLLALVFQLQCQLTKARSLFEQALRIWEQVLGPEHPHPDNVLNNLGYVLLLQGDYAGARSFFERALASRRRTVGLKDAQTARIMHNLGYLFLKQAAYRASRRYLKLALAIRRQVLPPEDISTAATLTFLGEVLCAQADYARTWYCHQQALDMRRNLYGDDHQDTAESLYHLGCVLYAQGDLVEARSHLEQALAKNMDRLGAEHYDTALALNSLGALLRDQGHYTEARSYLDQALIAWECMGGIAIPKPCIRSTILVCCSWHKVIMPEHVPT